MLLWLSGCFFVLVIITISCSDDDPSPFDLQLNEEFSGGEGTVFDSGTDAFDKINRIVTGENPRRFRLGNSFFRSTWVPSPSSTTARDGLGPIMNAISCTSCHIRDGRGSPPENFGDPLVSMLLRLSIPGMGDNGGPLGDPNYGGQFQTRAIFDIAPEGQVDILYEEVPGTYEDGEGYSLRRPTYLFRELGYGELSGDIRFSPRVAPFTIGLGLLESITEQELLAHADPDDLDGDGISGRPNRVWDPLSNSVVIGRFGWKANQPSLVVQNAGAFSGDLGLTTHIFPEQPCSSTQQDCLEAPQGEDVEISDEILDFVTAYTQSIGVPARRDWDSPEVLRGKQLFFESGCETCHVSEFEITDPIADFPEYSGQIIRPYTDLLLHDMGEDLSDDREDFLATGSEWRTPPLWGIGLVETVNGHTNFLHDGRARGFAEAILWHGGEAEASREAFRSMDRTDRENLILFLESL